RLVQLYVHEWSALLPHEIGADGLYECDWIAGYRDLEARGVYLFVDGERPGGFGLVSRFPGGGWAGGGFFVGAGARPRGVGRAAAAALFATRPGPWTLTVRPENPRARAFWSAILPDAGVAVEVGADGVARTRLSFLR